MSEKEELYRLLISLAPLLHSAFVPQKQKEEIEKKMIDLKKRIESK